MANPDDDIDFAAAMQGVQQIDDDKIHPRSITQPPTIRRRTPTTQTTRKPNTHAGYRQNELGASDLFYACTGVNQQALRRLKRGAFSFDSTLDLHGLTWAAAETELAEWLDQCVHDSIRCGLLIHGKGLHSPVDEFGRQLPTLKQQSALWLMLQAEILAYSSAQPKHGGNGAMYVLFMRQ